MSSIFQMAGELAAQKDMSKLGGKLTGVAQPNRAQRGETEDQEGGAGQEGGVDEVLTV